MEWSVSSTAVMEYLACGVVILVLSFIYASVASKRDRDERPTSARPNKSEETMTKGERKSGGVPQQGTKVSKKKPQQTDKWRQESKHSFSHDWLLTSLKGHTSPVLDLDFSPNGKYLASCAEDRAVFVWYTKDLKEKDHKFVRYNVELDHASLIRWSPDSKAFLLRRHSDNTLQVCRMTRKSDGSLGSIVKAHIYQPLHKDSTVGMGIDVNGRFIMSCSSGTEVVLVDLKGTELARFDTYLINNYSAKVSPCGRFLAASGFAADVKVWEVEFSKDGEWKQVKRAFELTGHSSGVYDFAFNADSTKMATVSRDGTWRLYNIKIDYLRGEEAELVGEGRYRKEGEMDGCCLALSPSGDVIVVAFLSTLVFINTVDASTDLVIQHPGKVTKVCFDSAGDYVVTAGDKHVHIFHNVTGRRAAMLSANRKLSAAGITSATRERLEQIIADSQTFLRNFSS